ncbi:MAG TPA: tetratricopeptide repeat protein [Candidatus Angelobacter sp.]|nr:tetratricopeptide repeat protein [Candidatus Angelobacter sp.]
MASTTLTPGEEAQLAQTIEMFEVITESQPTDYQSLEILKEAYSKLGRDQDVVKTSKRIAEAYVQMGQLSSAILEYETILQRFPDDPDVQKALKQIESKANNFSQQIPTAEAPAAKPAPASSNGKAHKSAKASADKVDDGRQAMHKIFVDGKIISAGDFDLCWVAPDLSRPPETVSEPFITVLAAKGILPAEKALKILSDKSRVGYLPLEKYEMDVELARSFPADVCKRWCVLPFDRMSKSILVATANPFNQQAAKELAEATQNRLLWYLVEPGELIKTLRKVFR